MPGSGRATRADQRTRAHRQHMQLKKTCPQCHAEADESRIKGNSAVAEIVKAWKDARRVQLGFGDPVRVLAGQKC